MTLDEFRLFHALIYDASGMWFGENRIQYLETRIRKRLQIHQISSVYAYYKFLKNGEEGEKELRELLQLLTINETYFFRNRPQFDLFEQQLIPSIVSRKKAENSKVLRIWSAGCSTGEEPYSISIAILENVPFPRSWDVKIYASDLNFSVLRKAREGIYSRERLRDVTPRRLSLYFSPSAEGFAIRSEAKEQVVFDFHNLKNDNGLHDLDVIFCRNVMIYFDIEEQKRLVQKFYQALRPGGYLLVGHAETLQGLSKDFRFVYKDKGAAYEKK